MAVTRRTARAAVDALDAAGVPFALIGAMALAAHGVARNTRDADLLATDRRALDPMTWDQARRQVSVDVRSGDADDPLAGVIRIGAARSALPVEVIVPRAAWFSSIVERARASGHRWSIGGVVVPVVALPDLVLLKAEAAGTIDHLDIALILDAWPEQAQALVDHVDQHLSLLDAYSRERWIRFRRNQT